MKKKIFTTIIALCIMLFAFSTVNALAAYSGTCGDNLTWTLDDYGTLTISGSGDMWNYRDYNSFAPWYYSYRSQITSVIIGNSVTSIGDRAFEDCESLTSVTIPDSVTSIGGSAFNDCGSLTSVTIPDSVTSIGDCAFCFCDSLTSVTIGNSVTSIGYLAFSDCESLTSVAIGNSVTSVGDYAFYYCKSLTSVTIPDSVTSVGDYAFKDCESLTSVNYNGTEADRNKITIGRGNGPLRNATWNYSEKPTVISNPSPWAENDVNYAILCGLVPEELQSDYTSPITRLDFCKLAVRLYENVKGALTGNYPCNFSDTESLTLDEQQIIGKANTIGIINGYAYKTFKPHNSINRQEAAVMLMRTAQVLGLGVFEDNQINTYEDCGDSAAWAMEGIKYVYNAGIMNGTNVSADENKVVISFSPYGNYTREQAIVTFYRLYNMMK